MTKSSLWKLLSIAAVLALLVVACGDDDDDASPTATSPSEGGAPTATSDTGGEDGEDGDGELVAMGEQLYTEQGCAGCHSTDGSTSVGPSWQGLYGSEETLVDGSTVTVDDAYLRESIVDPSAAVVEGFAEGLMPPYDQLTDEQINAIIAFIESLS